MSDWTDPRPMSPHLWSWRWHLTMLTSILHRLTGFANIAGLLLLIGWLFSLASGAQTYASFIAWASDTLLVQIVIFGVVLGFLFHVLNGIRYLFWDMGRGLDPALASLVSAFNIAGALIGSALIWVFIL